MRNSNTIELLQKTHSDPFSLKDIVDNEELLKYYFDNESNVIQKNTGPKVLEIEKNHKLLQPVIQKMREKLLPFKVRYAHFFDVTDPHIIHNDDEFEFPYSYKAFTIPLKIYGECDDIKLVTFDHTIMAALQSFSMEKSLLKMFIIINLLLLTKMYKVAVMQV